MVGNSRTFVQTSISSYVSLAATWKLSCAALRTRIEAMKDAALVHHRCVPDPARAAFVDEMVDGVIALRARMEADCR